MVRANATREGDLASPMGVATEFLAMSSTQAQFAVRELITLGGMVSSLQTPFACRVLIVGSLLPRVHDLLYAILYIFSSDVIGRLYTIQHMGFKTAICICHGQSFS
jgi:hypothetical protein